MTGPWVAVPEAAKLAGRQPRTVYEWVQSGKLRSRVGENGTIEVDAAQVVDVEPTIRRGRPRGSARPPTHRRGAA